MDPLVDLADVQRLIDIVQRHGLEGLTVTDDEVEVTILAAMAPMAAVEPGETVAPPVAEVPTPEPAPSGLVPLRSPITGVFYRSPRPSEPPFVQVGDLVEAHDPVCLIEAMKIFNEIPSGVSGRVARFVAQNEQLVVTGEVLMEFEPVAEDRA